MCKNPFLFLKIVEASFCGPRNCLYSMWICSANEDTSTFFGRMLSCHLGQ